MIKTGSHRFDKFIALSGAAIPVGVAVGNAGFEAAVVLTAILWIVRVIKFKDLDYRCLLKHPVIMPSIAVYISILLSVVINGGGSKGYLHDIVMIRHLLCIMALIDTSFRFPVWKYFFYGLFACFAFVATNIIVVNVMGHDMLGEPLSRYTGKYKEGNRYPTLLTFITIFFLSWGVLTKHLTAVKRSIIIAAGLTGFAFFCFFRIRTVLLAFSAGVFFIIAYAVLRNKSTRLKILFIVLTAILCVIFVQATDMFSLHTIHDRLFIWQNTFQMWLENPIFGCGISSFKDLYSETAGARSGQTFFDTSVKEHFTLRAYHAHNNLLQILSCTGILGLGASLWLAFNTICMTFKNVSEHFHGYLSWPVIYFTISFAGFSIYAGWYMALTVFIISALCCKKRE